MVWNRLSVEGPARLSLHLLVVRTRGLGLGFHFLAEYVGPDWIFIPAGGTLGLVLDGEVVTLTGRGSRGRRTVLDSDEAKEVAYYEVSRELLGRMARARRIEAELCGIRGSFRPSALERLRRLARLHGCGPAESGE
jgi:hypothetical protein